MPKYGCNLTINDLFAMLETISWKTSFGGGGTLIMINELFLALDFDSSLWKIIQIKEMLLFCRENLTLRYQLHFVRPFWEREKSTRQNQIDTFLWVNSNLKSLASVKSIWLFRKMQKSGTIDEWYGTSSIISYSFLFGSEFAYLMFKQIDNNLTYYSIMYHHIWNQKCLGHGSCCF